MVLALPACQYQSTVEQNAAQDAEPHTLLECDTLPEGADAFLQPRSMLLLGEYHGTNEAPQLLEALACHGLRKGLSVRLGYEAPADLNPELESYLSSDGSPAQRRQLLSNELFWQKPTEFKDGRDSLALFRLIETARTWRNQGHPIGVFFMIGGDPSLLNTPGDWDKAANVQTERQRHPEDLIIVAAGNKHTSIDPKVMGMGSILRGDGVPLTSLVMRVTGGSYWRCSFDDCGPQPLSSSLQVSRTPTVRLFADSEAEADFWDGVIQIGELTPSPAASLSLDEIIPAKSL